MLTQAKVYHLVPWAWSAAWMLTGVGIAISDVYSSPSKSNVPFIVLSALGWGIAGIVTSSAAGHKSSIAIRIVAWAVAYLVFMLFGFFWLHSWNLGFLGPVVATGVAGVIGGVFSSKRSGVWRLVSGALVGLAFLLFATFNLYASYILISIYSGGALLINETVTNVFVWGLPGAFFGLSAGFLASLILGITIVVPTIDPTTE